MDSRTEEYCNFDIYEDCGNYYDLTDYCEAGLFGLDEKFGRRLSVTECLNFKHKEYLFNLNDY